MMFWKLWSYSLLLRRECCSFSNGEYLKAGLHELELWCLKATDQVALYICHNLCLDLKGKSARNTFSTSFYLLYLVYIAVCWVILGWTQTHTPSCGLSGILSWIKIKENTLLILSLPFPQYSVFKILCLCRFCIKRLKNLWRRSQMSSAR